MARLETRLDKLEKANPLRKPIPFTSVKAPDGNIIFIHGTAEELAECERQGIEVSHIRIIGVRPGDTSK